MKQGLINGNDQEGYYSSAFHPNQFTNVHMCSLGVLESMKHRLVVPNSEIIVLY